MSLELYHWEPSGDSAKALFCLKEIGVEFRGHYVDVMNFEQYRPDYLAIAPMGQVPVLLQDGKVINEPKLLLEYLADAFPAAKLAPTDAAGWYDVQAWIRYTDAQLNDAVRLLGWHTVMLPEMSEAARQDFEKKLANVPVKEQQAGWAAVVRDAESTENKLENARGRVREALERMEEALARSEWLVGDMFSIADINAFALAWPLPKLIPDDVNVQKTPSIKAWLQRAATRPAFKAAMSMRRAADEVPRFAPA
jgi:glutathione S-transferase/GST-like protein